MSLSPHSKKLREIEPDLVEVQLALGESYFIKGESEKALAVFAKALELQPENAEIYYNIGSSCIRATSWTRRSRISRQQGHGPEVRGRLLPVGARFPQERR